MQLELPKEFEEMILQKAHVAGFDSIEEHILDLMEHDNTDPGNVSHKENWLTTFDALVKKQVSRNPEFDDSRDSIYQER